MCTLLLTAIVVASEAIAEVTYGLRVRIELRDLRYPWFSGI